MLSRQDLKKINVGKLVGPELYVHSSAIDLLPPTVRKVVLQHWTKAPGANIIKISKANSRISYLYYPDFENEANPALAKSVAVDLVSGRSRVRNYSDSQNPPILHRKETLVISDHELYRTFKNLTDAEEEAGLYENSKRIGFQRQWERLLKRKGYRIIDHELREIRRPDPRKAQSSRTVVRHKTAIVRYEPSRPIKSLLAHGLLDGELWSNFVYERRRILNP